MKYKFTAPLVLFALLNGADALIDKQVLNQNTIENADADGGY